MINTSALWDVMFNERLVPETNVKIMLDITDPVIGEIATVTAFEEADFSNSANMANVPVLSSENEYRSVFLEQNMWVLDGYGNITEDDYVATGYVCTDGYIGEDHLTITLSEVASTAIPGFTINWSVEQNEWATEFYVNVYNGDTRIASLYVENDSPISVVDLPVSNYDRVVIRVEDWSLPCHRIRIEQFLFGHAVLFDKKQILSYTHEQSGDPISQELSHNRIEFSLDNSDDKWNPLNPTGMYTYLYEQQRVVVYYGAKLLPLARPDEYTWIRAGVFYLTEWIAPSNGLAATFVAEDVFALLQAKTFSYQYSTTLTLNPYPQDETSDPVNVYSTPEDVVTRSNPIGTIPLGSEIVIYEGSSQRRYGLANPPYYDIWLAVRVDQGWIYGGKGTRSVFYTSDGKLSKVVELAMSNLPFKVSYDSTCFDDKVSPITLENVSAGEFVQLACNAEKISHRQDKDGRILFETLYDWPADSNPSYVIQQDKSYLHPELELPKPIKQIIISSYNRYEVGDCDKIVVDIGSSGEIITVDNPYDYVVGTYTADHYLPKKVITGEFLANPKLELFDFVTIESKYGTIAPVRLTRIKYTYTGSFHCEYTGLIMD